MALRTSSRSFRSALIAATERVTEVSWESAPVKERAGLI
jgi:hypothetical protein